MRSFRSYFSPLLAPEMETCASTSAMLRILLMNPRSVKSLRCSDTVIRSMDESAMTPAARAFS